MPYITSVERIGFERGQKEGHKKGHKEGREEGREEERRSLALKMIQEQVDFDLISRITGFSIAELQELQQLQTEDTPES